MVLRTLNFAMKFKSPRLLIIFKCASGMVREISSTVAPGCRPMRLTLLSPIMSPIFIRPRWQRVTHRSTFADLKQKKYSVLLNYLLFYCYKKNLGWSCVYPLKMKVNNDHRELYRSNSNPDLDQIKVYIDEQRGHGTFKVVFEIYEDANFTSIVDPSGIPFLMIGDFLRGF